jgi:YD repeat-containing protein
MGLTRIALLVGISACGGTRSSGPTPPAPGKPDAPVASVPDPDGPLCAVLRANAPRSVMWAQHGCPPDPGPLVEGRRPCRVHWGTDVMDLRYDVAGRLAEVVNRAFATKYTYDDGGRLTGIAWTVGGRDLAIEVVHDGGQVTYRSDISEHRATVDGGQMTRFEIDENHVCTLSRDERGGIRELSSAHNGEVINAAKFTRDAAGLLVRRQDGQIAWTYSWDAAGRLTKIGGWEAPVTVDYSCK